MTYFNPRIFNKNNLKEKDRQELDYWHGEFINCVDNELADYECDDDIPFFSEVKRQIVKDFCERLKESWGYVMQENIVGIIENYDEDIEEVENPDTYFYEGEEENGDSEES